MSTELTDTIEPEDFIIKVLDRKDKERRISGFFTEGDHRCVNCRSQTISERYVLETFSQTPNPAVFGPDAKPTVYTRDVHKSFYCRKCGIENLDMAKVAVCPPSDFVE